MHDQNIVARRTHKFNGSGTEKKVVASLNEFCKEKTMLIVTHRNPILAMVDRVFVIDNGQIISDQTPEKLGIKKVVNE